MPGRATRFLLSAGPTSSSHRVLAAQSAPVLSYRDPEFVGHFRQLTELVGDIYRTRNDIIVMQGEAVLGLEAVLAATVRPGMKVINVSSGPYGKYMDDWLRRRQAEIVEIATSFREVPTVAMIQAAVSENPDAEMLCVVHVETPCGTVLPVREIGSICRAAGIVSFVDAVASLGGVPLLVDDWELDICVAGPEKCLGGPSGLSLVSVSSQGWELIERNPAAPRGSFLSILDWKETWLKKGSFPYGPSIATVEGTLAACEELLEEGLEVANLRHRVAAEATRAGVVAMGLELWPRSGVPLADSVTAISLPDGLTDAQVIRHTLERYGVLLAGGDGAGSLVRIGHMAAASGSLNCVVGLSALGQCIKEFGYSVDVGRGVAAAMEALSTQLDQELLGTDIASISLT